MHMLAWWNKITKQKTKSDEYVWQVSFLLFKTVFNSTVCTKEPKIAEDMKIYNSQLVMGLILKVHFRFTAVQSTGLCYHHGMVQRDPCLGTLFVGFSCYMLQNNGACECTSLVRTKSKRDTVKEALRIQLINMRQSQTTQLLLHNCPIK